MKNYVLAILIITCIFKNVSADWRLDAMKDNLDKVNDIVLRTQLNVKNYGIERGADYKECKDSILPDLRVTMRSAYVALTDCTYPPIKSEIETNDCAQKEISKMMQASQEIEMVGKECIDTQFYTTLDN